ncbi:MAG: hypothetical protein K2V38_28630, partial [Gemmataceae bacterium]|nr:hypothetical protein [Gemmataceae bacterium]
MNFFTRLRMLPVLLGALATSAAVGTTLFGDMRPGKTNPPAAPAGDAKPDGDKLVDGLAATQFSKTPVLTYQPRDGELLFAWQVKPELPAQPVKPRDVLVVVDTTASQAGRPLQQARQIVSAVAAGLAPDDRVSVWSLSTPATTRALTKGFQAPNAEDVALAAAALTEIEYGSGAADLKGGLEKALA